MPSLSFVFWPDYTLRPVASDLLQKCFVIKCRTILQAQVLSGQFLFLLHHTTLLN